MLRADHSETLQLVDRLCECFASTSKDDDHPAVRYGRQLTDLRRKLAGLRQPVSLSLIRIVGLSCG